MGRVAFRQEAAESSGAMAFERKRFPAQGQTRLAGPLTQGGIRSHKTQLVGAVSAGFSL
jgi:hypothetical protein